MNNHNENNEIPVSSAADGAGRSIIGSASSEAQAHAVAHTEAILALTAPSDDSLYLDDSVNVDANNAFRSIGDDMVDTASLLLSTAPTSAPDDLVVAPQRSVPQEAMNEETKKTDATPNPALSSDATNQVNAISPAILATTPGAVAVRGIGFESRNGHRSVGSSMYSSINSSMLSTAPNDRQQIPQLVLPPDAATIVVSAVLLSSPTAASQVPILNAPLPPVIDAVIIDAQHDLAPVDASENMDLKRFDSSVLSSEVELTRDLKSERRRRYYIWLVAVLIMMILILAGVLIAFFVINMKQQQREGNEDQRESGRQSSLEDSDGRSRNRDNFDGQRDDDRDDRVGEGNNNYRKFVRQLRGF
jgi:hypothetical protein